MQSKYQFDNSPVYIKGTDVPHNKLGITDSDILHELEKAHYLQSLHLSKEEWVKKWRILSVNLLRYILSMN